MLAHLSVIIAWHWYLLLCGCSYKGAIIVDNLQNRVNTTSLEGLMPNYFQDGPTLVFNPCIFLPSTNDTILMLAVCTLKSSAIIKSFGSYLVKVLSRSVRIDPVKRESW